MTSETSEKEYAGKGIAGTGLGLGIAGTALALLNGGSGLLGLGGNSNNGRGFGPVPQSHPHDFISRDEFIMNSQLMARDAQIADLKAEMKDEKKMTEVYAVLNAKINDVNDKVLENRDRADDRLANAVEKINGKIDFNKSIQDGINCTQMSYNATNSAQIACLQNQIAQLQGMTKLVIPNTSVCPGWGNVTITPTVLSA